MALKRFRVENQKALRLAECDNVPAVMVIAGPNGVGKSTLLHALHRRQGAVYDEGTVVIYQPPHRAIGRQRVQRRNLFGQIRRLLDIFSGSEVQGIEGIRIVNPARAPDSVDEAGSTIKFTLGRIENRRLTHQSLLVDRYKEMGEKLDPSGLPEVYEPVRRLVSRLLPHLEFKRVDFSDEDNIRCVFARKDGVSTDELDLDDLSSGEKAIILLFLPLIEHEINRLLEGLEKGHLETIPAPLPDRCFILDEPEQHLHPDLQARILGYLRDESARQRTQFIMATHSPTFVDQAHDVELYVLNFSSATDQNQLRRVATSTDRLEALRALTGSTYVITAGRPIVCIEGNRDDQAATLTDARLLEILHPRATRYTFIPVGGKGNVLRVVPELRAKLAEEDFGIKVFGIVDMDRSEVQVAGIASWPVCNIENLLLDGNAISEAVRELDESRAVSPATVQTMITDVAKEERDTEIRLRVMLALKPRTIRVKALSREEVKGVLAREFNLLNLSDDEIDKVIAKETRQVDKALADGSFIRVFRGKELLRGVYQRLGLAQIPFDRFVYSVAVVRAREEGIRKLLDGVFDVLERAEERSVPISTSGTDNRGGTAENLSV